MKDERVKFYTSACFKYGFLTLLYLLKEFESEERYQDCDAILKALKQLNSRHNLDIPTTGNKEAIAYFKQACNELNVHTGTLENVPYYAQIVKEEMTNLL
jgi:hypothetical protein